MWKLLNKILLSSIVLIAVCVNADAAKKDYFSRDWWAAKSGITSGTINDIKYQYLGSKGYTGTLADRTHSWLVEITGSNSYMQMSELIKICFEDTEICENYDKGVAMLGDNFMFVDGNDFYFNDGNNFVFLETTEG